VTVVWTVPAPLKIAKSDTQPCTLALKVHGCVSFSAILVRRHPGLLPNNPRTPDKPATTRNYSNRINGQHPVSRAMTKRKPAEGIQEATGRR
jgi:hypothetical protein